MPIETRAIDFVGYDHRGQVVLLAEPKSRLGTSEEWAAQLRRNILEQDALPETPFFLIATPDRIYIWKQRGLDVVEGPPDIIINARIALASYFEKLGRPVAEISPESFEFVVLWWLDDLASSSIAVDRQDASIRLLAESGLLDSIRNARIEHQAA